MKCDICGKDLSKQTCIINCVDCWDKNFIKSFVDVRVQELERIKLYCETKNPCSSITSVIELIECRINQLARKNQKKELELLGKQTKQKDVKK